MVLRPMDKSLEVYADAGFAGDFIKEYVDDPSMTKSCTRCVIVYGGCPPYVGL